MSDVGGACPFLSELPEPLIILILFMIMIILIKDAGKPPPIIWKSLLLAACNLLVRNFGWMEKNVSPH